MDSNGNLTLQFENFLYSKPVPNWDLYMFMLIRIMRKKYLT